MHALAPAQGHGHRVVVVGAELGLAREDRLAAALVLRWGGMEERTEICMYLPRLRGYSYPIICER